MSGCARGRQDRGSSPSRNRRSPSSPTGKGSKSTTSRTLVVKEERMEDLKAYIREVPDFPKPGILFYDITTLLQDPLALRMTVDRFVWFFAQKRIDKVVGIESRGFIFAPTVAYNLNAGFVPVRKPGKLPYQAARQGYDLEYGTDSIEMHNDA